MGYIPPYGPSIQEWMRQVSGAVNPLLSRSRDTVSIRDYGASLNGIDDDVPAWSKLFADHPAGGIKVQIDGYCRINSSITPPAGMSNVQMDFGATGFLYNPVHGFDMLVLPATVAGWSLVFPRFFTDTGPSGATERFVLRNQSNDLITEHLWVRNCWSGVFTSGAKVHMYGRTYLDAMKAAAGTGLLLDMGSNEDFLLQDVFGENAGGSDCLAGVQIISASDAIIGGTMAKCGTPLLVAPTAGKVVATLGLWPYFNGDTSSGHGAQFTGVGTIQRVEGVLRVSSNAGNGLTATISPHSADLMVRAVANAGHGVTLASGGTQYNSRYRAAAYGNGLSGFNVEPNATDFSADVMGGSGDDFGGNAQYSAAIGTGCDHFDVKVSGRGDALGQLFNAAGTSATKVVTSRN